MPEKADGFIYDWVTIYGDSMRFFAASARFYQHRLEQEVSQIKEDPLFAELLSERDIESLDIAKEARRFGKLADRLQEKLDAAPDAWDYDLTMTHRDVRVLKALGREYLRNLRHRRNDLASSKSFSIAATQALDARLTRFEELLESSVFREATPWPLLVEYRVEDLPGLADEPKETQASRPSPPPRVLSSVEILDPQLRSRCLRLLDAIESSEEPETLDTIVTDATRVLEDRIRRLSGADASLEGASLMAFAFSGQSPRLVVSKDSSEQAAAHLMFRGVFGFIRNPFHHRLIDNLARERAIQILGFIDYLLLVAQEAEQQSPQDA